MAKLRVGVVGVGPMGQGHVKHYRTIPGCELVAISDMDPARRAETAVKSGAMAFAEPKDLIGRGDAVSIATPTVTHLDIALRFIDAGVHVLVEKPMAASSREAEEIVAAARRKGVVLQVGHIERFNPAIQEIRRRIEIGQVGQVYQISTRRQGPFPARIADVGVVKDLATHDIDLTAWVA